jgi:hypothetical protein
MSHLRLVPPLSSNEPVALSYENRLGDRYYLHQGATKTGKPRYFFAKTVREGALTAMPAGFEVSESANGVVSVRRQLPGGPAIPDADLEVVRSVLAAHPRLRQCVARIQKRAIVVYEPVAGIAALDGLSSPRMDRVLNRGQVQPVIKLERRGGEYAVFRMTYRGRSGWSYCLATGKLQALATRYLRLIGTDDLYELFEGTVDPEAASRKRKQAGNKSARHGSAVGYPGFRP